MKKIERTMSTKRKIVCPNCKTKLKFDPDKILSKVVKFKCPACTSVLRIKKPDPDKRSSSSQTTSDPEPKAKINMDEIPAPTGKSEMEIEFSKGAPDDPGLVLKELEPGISEEVEGEVPVARKPFPEEDEGPLIPEDRPVAPKPAGESLLEEFNHEQLREFEDGEAGAEDAEWTRYAVKKGPEQKKSKIDMNELPASAADLEETLISLLQAETYKFQGETDISNNHYNQAIKNFTRALEINPDYVDALVNRGSACAIMGRFNDALMDFNHALKFEKKDAEIYYKRGEIYLLNKMYDLAIKDFTATIILNPMFSYAYLNRGRAYSGKGMQDEAMNNFKQAIETDSDSSFGFIDRAAPGVDFDEERAGNEKEAAEFNKQGLSDLENEKYKEAIENFTLAINLSSTDAEGYINRGQSYIELDNPDEAMADFNKAVLYDPLNSFLYYLRAQTWKAKKEMLNMSEDLKVSCEMGYEPACIEYREHTLQKG
jgi:tetratricopeptide (TPR) repeat protein